jgi:hypothetical protein
MDAFFVQESSALFQQAEDTHRPTRNHTEKGILFGATAMDFAVCLM